MKFGRHLRDASGTLVASAVATGSDAVVYAALVLSLVEVDALSVGLAASIGALVGGLIHYSLCRFWVFRRFEAPITSSFVLYLTMSWLAAAGHGLLTHWLSGFAGVALGWLISKCVLWIFWTYPLSRYVVFHEHQTSNDSP